ncbi:hypothetical protein MMC13_006448 [Lambiella insularis]|nr:hypothetical protein [Lambiella insularis]
MFGSEPFEPPPAVLSSLLASTATAFSQYLGASSPLEKTVALGALARTSQELSKTATQPIQAVDHFVNHPHANACVRIATAMGVFEALPAVEPATLQHITLKTGAEPDFALRIMRTLAAIGVIQEVDQELYAHTSMSILWASRIVQTAFKHLDDLNLTISHFPQYFEKYGFKSPADPKNTPAAFARGEQDIDIFTLMARYPPSLDVFNETMSIGSMLAAKEICRSFKFDSLRAGKDGVALVDVGGGKGQLLREIFQVFPNIQGRVVLEDLKFVLDAGTAELGNGVECLPYNFLEDAQPIIGATAYLFKWIFHDWPDDHCLTILANLAPAIRGHGSKLLICDLVIPDRHPSSSMVLRDINMLQFAGKERSQKEWHELLSKGGFRINKIHGLDNQMSSIIEAEIDDRSPDSADMFVRPAVPCEQTTVKLTAVDQLITNRSYIPWTLCFKLDSDADSKVILADLVTGLSRTLVEIPFLAGSIMPKSHKGGAIELVVDSDCGVTFKVQDHRVRSTNLPVYTFDELEELHFPPSKLYSFLCIPGPEDAEIVKHPVLRVNADLICGGLLLTCCIHHAAVDASGSVRVLKVWAAHTKAAAEGQKLVLPPIPLAALDRSPLLKTINGLVLDECPELRVLDMLQLRPAPASVEKVEGAFDLDHYADNIGLPLEKERPKAVTTWWYFPPEKQQELKATAQAGIEAGFRVSTNDAICALLWRRSNVARGLLERDLKSSTFWIPVNIRSRLNMHPDFLGNAVYIAHSTSSLVELCSAEPDGLSRTANRIREAVDGIDTLKMRQTFGLIDSMPPGSLIYNFDLVGGTDYFVTSCAKYDLYDQDWGCNLRKITRARFKMPTAVDGTAMINPVDRDGGLEVMIICETNVLEQLKTDKEFTKFAQLRCI